MLSGSGIIDKLLEDIPIPRGAKVEKRFERPFIADIEAEFLKGIGSPAVLKTIYPDWDIAIHRGSRTLEKGGIPEEHKHNGRRDERAKRQ